MISTCLQTLNMQPLFHFIISILVGTELNMVKSVCCSRDPEEIQMAQSVNNHFKIGIIGNPDKYVPGQVYAGIKCTAPCVIC
jgi:hypothetical protein